MYKKRGKLPLQYPFVPPSIQIEKEIYGMMKGPTN